MPHLKLLAILCHATEDWTGADEVYLKIGGERVWGPVSMNDDDKTKTRVIEDDVDWYEFAGEVSVELFDQDAGGFLDPNDHLGTQIVRETDRDGWLAFTEDDANYSVKYKVRYMS